MILKIILFYVYIYIYIYTLIYILSNLKKYWSAFSLGCLILSSFTIWDWFCLFSSLTAGLPIPFFSKCLFNFLFLITHRFGIHCTFNLPIDFVQLDRNQFQVLMRMCWIWICLSVLSSHSCSHLRWTFLYMCIYIYICRYCLCIELFHHLFGRLKFV